MSICRDAMISSDNPDTPTWLGPSTPEEFQERVAEAAYLAWETAGRQTGMALDFWLSAERYVRGLTTMVARTAWWPVIDQKALGELHASVAQYFKRVRELAHLMWQSGGGQHGTPLDIWLAAERHGLAVMAATIRTASSAAGAADALARAFGAFSAIKHLNHVRETAYRIWEASGRQPGHALEHWLVAEEHVLSMLMMGNVGPFPPAAEDKSVSAGRD